MYNKLAPVEPEERRWSSYDTPSSTPDLRKLSGPRQTFTERGSSGAVLHLTCLSKGQNGRITFSHSMREANLLYSSQIYLFIHSSTYAMTHIKCVFHVVDHAMHW